MILLSWPRRLAAVLFVVSVPLWAESDSGTIKGKVTDALGASLTGAQVTARIPSTGFRRTVLTDREGSYVLPGIPNGAVQLVVEMSGFQTLTYADVHLSTGQIWTRDVQLGVAAKSDYIEVRAEALGLNRENAEMGDVVGSRQLGSIPLNGRNWQGLLMLAPGSVNTGNGDGRGVRFLGRGQDDNSFKLDGVDATGIRNQVPRDDIRLAIPLESVAEFRVRSGQYTAESGGNMGGQVEIVSRSGSNQFQGSLFEYFRNDKLDARSPFDPANKPPFRLNQFGASLGGYLVKDKTFFFANYEGLAQRLAQTLTGFVPTDAYRARASTAAPILAPLINGYPRATGSTASDDIGVWSGRGSQNNDQHSGMFRLDQRFSDNDLFFARFNSTHMEAQTPLLRDTTGQLGGNNNVSEHITTGVLSYQNVISRTLINDLRAGVNRIPYTSYWDSPTLPAVTVAGFTTIPGGRRNMVNSTSFTYADTLTWVHGRHTLKSGFEMRRLKMAPGVWVDASTIAFQNPTTLAAGQFTSSTLISPTAPHGVLKNQYFGFVQDDFKITPTFSASLGIRYENLGVLHEEHGRAKPFDLETCGGWCPAGAPFSFADNNNVAPRIGLAWSPAALHSRTVIRTGVGMFYGEGQLGNQLSPVENEAYRVQFNGTLPAGITLADLLAGVPPTGIAVTQAPLNMERKRKDMYTTQWSFSVQQALASGFLAEAGYIGTKGTQLFERTYTNAINPATGTRPYPQFGLLAVRANGNDSSFQGMTLSLRRQTGAGLTMSANYQWSHAIDNGTAGGDDAVYPQNIWNRRAERASSDFDVRQNFTVNAVYGVPFHGRGIPKAIFGGWEASAIAVARSGRPVNITVSRAASALPDGNVTSPQRPDLISGVSLVPENQGVNNWINLAAFATPRAGVWGNAGRNLVTGPGCVNFDASLARRFPIAERARLEFRAEVFNIANNPKYANPTANVSAPATFGKITGLVNTGPTGTGTARQIELALRVSF